MTQHEAVYSVPESSGFLLSDLSADGNNRKYELELSASLDALEAQLGSRFVRTHRSYLVNQRHILSYDAGTMTVTLDDESVVYLSRTGKQD